MIKSILVIGDLHITRKEYDQSKALIEKLIEIQKQNKCDTVILVGDVFHDHAKIYCELHPLYERLLNGLMVEDNTSIYHLLGNHEMPNSVTVLPKNHVLNFYKEHESVTIIDEPTIIGNKNCTIGLYPYYPVGQFPEIPNNVKLAFAHQEFDGVLFKGAGDPIPECNVISGHIHEPMVIRGNNDYTVRYVGSPRVLEFGSSTDNRYVSIISNITKKGYDEKRVEVDLPTKETIEITDLENIPWGKLKDNNNFLRFVIHSDKVTSKSFKKTKEYKRLLKKGKVVFKTIVPEIPTEDVKQEDFWVLMEGIGEVLKPLMEEVLNEIEIA